MEVLECHRLTMFGHVGQLHYVPSPFACQPVTALAASGSRRPWAARGVSCRTLPAAAPPPSTRRAPRPAPACPRPGRAVGAAGRGGGRDRGRVRPRMPARSRGPSACAPAASPRAWIDRCKTKGTGGAQCGLIARPCRRHSQRHDSTPTRLRPIGRDGEGSWLGRPK